MLFKSLIMAALVSAPVSGVCNNDWCTSPGPPLYDCIAGGNGEKCTCSKGSARLVDGDGGSGYYSYTCCDDDDKRNIGDNCDNLSKCDQKYCVSPNGEGGKDCIASQFEGCTCSEGTVAALTGATTENQGDTFYEYTCCPADLDIGMMLVGEMCGFPCFDYDEIMNEDSEGVLEGCASGSNFGNPCEVMYQSSRRVAHCFSFHVEAAFFKSPPAKGRISAYCFRRA
jgi:hypothetical protein